MGPREGNKGWAKHPPGPSLGLPGPTCCHEVASARWLMVLLLRSLPWVQARYRPAAVVGLVLVRGIASGRAPLYSAAALPPVPSVVPPVGLQLGSRLGVWGLRLERLP